MGLFSSKKVTTITVATQAMRVVKDSQLPNSRLAGMAEYLKNGNGFVERIENNLVNGIGQKANSYHARAMKQYIWGVPQGNLLVMSRSLPSVISSIAAEEKVAESDISIEYSYYMPLNLYHLAWIDLITLHGYDPDTNKLGKLSTDLAQTVYLDDLVLVMRSINDEEESPYSDVVLESWGRPTTSNYSPSRPYEEDAALYTDSTEVQILDSLAVDAQFTVKYSYKPLVDASTNTLTTPGVTTGSFSLPAKTDLIKVILDESGKDTNLNAHKDQYQIKYKVKGKTKFITRDSSFVSGSTSGTVFTTPNSSAGNFFPLVYFRWDKKDITDEKQLTSAEDIQAFQDSKKLLNTLGLKYDEMGKSIHYETIEEETETTETYVDEDPVSKTYGQTLTRKRTKPVYKVDPVTGKKEKQYKERVNDNGEKQLKDIKSIIFFMGVPATPTGIDAEVEIKYLYDFFTMWASDPGNKTTAELFQTVGNNKGRNVKQKVENYNSIIIQDRRFKMALQNQGITITHRLETSKPAEGVKYTMNSIGSTHTYTFHNSDFTAIDVTVTGLKMVYYVGSGATAGYTDTADNLVNLDRHHLLIPLDKALTSSYSIIDREVLYSKSQHLLYNTEIITVTKIPWYATGFFKIFVMIIILVIAVVLVVIFPALMPAALSAAGAFMAAGMTGAALIMVAAFIVDMIIVAVIMHFVFKAVAKLIGPAAAAILGAVVMVVAIGYGIAGAMATTTTQASALLSTATTLMSVANGLVSAAGTEFQNLIGDVYKDFESFTKLTDEKDKELERAQALLENNNSVILEPFMVLGEEPEEYYNRTVHSANPGVACFDLLTSFCDILLTLPTINQTIKQEY
jgi:hypothetical protein